MARCAPRCLLDTAFQSVYNGLYWTHAATIVQFMWQHDTRAVVQLIKECMNAHGDSGLQSQASDQPWVLEVI